MMDKIYKIVITGPESTGKSTLTTFLAKNYKTIKVDEYAREYVEKLNRKYTYEDVEIIAKKQIELEELNLNKTNKILFVDTSLIITKVWFEITYNQIPEWLNIKIETTLADFYLLCNTDIEWEYDPVRENGGEMRNILFHKYKLELEKYKANFGIVSGTGEERFINAIKLLEDFLKKE